LFDRLFPRGALTDDFKRKLRVPVGNKDNTLFWVFAGQVQQQVMDARLNIKTILPTGKTIADFPPRRMGEARAALAVELT